MALVLLQPLFLVIFRLMVFDTVPHDDYAPFLLWLAGLPGGQFPASPYCYRILSMVAAWPLLAGLPVLSVTNLPSGLSAEYVRATGALAALSYGAMVAAGWWHTGRRAPAGGWRGWRRRGCSCCSAGRRRSPPSTRWRWLSSWRAWRCWRGRGGSPPCCWRRWRVNEKIALVLAVWLTLRCLLSAADRRDLWRCWLAAAGSVLLYGAAVALLHFPGNEYQQDPGSFATTLRDNLAAYASARGLLLNVLPALVLAAVAGWARWRRAPVRGADLLVIPALLGVAVVLTQFFQAGRIVMHAAPIFVGPAGMALAAWAMPAPPAPAPAAPAAAPRRTRD